MGWIISSFTRYFFFSHLAILPEFTKIIGWAFKLTFCLAVLVGGGWYSGRVMNIHLTCQLAYSIPYTTSSLGCTVLFLCQWHPELSGVLSESAVRGDFWNESSPAPNTCCCFCVFCPSGHDKLSSPLGVQQPLAC